MPETYADALSGHVKRSEDAMPTEIAVATPPEGADVAVPHNLNEDFDYVDDEGNLMAASNEHFLAASALSASLLRWLESRGRQGSVVGEIFHELGEGGGRLGPDVALVLDIPQVRGGLYRIGVDGPPPALAVELASPSTWRADLDQKWRRYQEAGVGVYVAFDLPGNLWLGDRLRVWQRKNNVYQVVSPRLVAGEQRWPIASLGLWLAAGVEELLVYDSDGEPILAGEPRARLEEALRLAAEEEAAQEKQLRTEERRRRAEAEARAAEEQRRRAEADARAAEADARAAEEQRRRAEAEARAAATDAALAALRAELAALRGQAAPGNG